MLKDEYALYGVSKDGLEILFGYFEQGINGGLDGAFDFVKNVYTEGDVYTVVQD